MLIRVGDFVADYYEVRRKSDNKRIKGVQIANDKSGYYERIKIDSDGDLVFDKKRNVYAREYKKEPIKFVRNTSYFTILMALFKRFFQDIGKFIEIEINVRKK